MTEINSTTQVEELDRKLHQLQALIVSASMGDMGSLGAVLTPYWHSLASDLIEECCQMFEHLHPEAASDGTAQVQL